MLANVEALTRSMSPCLLSNARSTGFDFEQPLPVETGAQMMGNNFVADAWLRRRRCSCHLFPSSTSCIAWVGLDPLPLSGDGCRLGCRSAAGSRSHVTGVWPRVLNAHPSVFNRRCDCRAWISGFNRRVLRYRLHATGDSIWSSFDVRVTMINRRSAEADGHLFSHSITD